MTRWDTLIDEKKNECRRSTNKDHCEDQLAELEEQKADALEELEDRRSQAVVAVAPATQSASVEARLAELKGLLQALKARTSSRQERLFGELDMRVLLIGYASVWPIRGPYTVSPFGSFGNTGIANRSADRSADRPAAPPPALAPRPRRRADRHARRDERRAVHRADPEA